MKAKIKSYFIKFYFNGLLTALLLASVIQSFVDKLDWLNCVLRIISIILLIAIIIFDFHIINKLVNKIDELDSENVSILGAQLYGNAKLEKQNRTAEELEVKNE